MAEAQSDGYLATEYGCPLISGPGKDAHSALQLPEGAEPSDAVWTAF